jgi:signal transduction histidine kinase
VIFSFFDSSSLNLFSIDCPFGREEEVGVALRESIEKLQIEVKGVMLLSNPIANDAGKMFNAFSDTHSPYLIFVGGAGDYDNQRKSILFDGTRCMTSGFVAVAFSGENLFIENLTYLEWYPFSKEMTITEAGDLSIKTIDDQPAFSIYHKYLGIEADDRFFMNSMEFPLLIQRNGNTVARTPFFADKNDGSIHLVADVQQGEKFRIGYGNPQIILKEADRIQLEMQRFQPEAILLFSCICRRFLMQQDVDMETMPYEEFAPTGGFYTFGEYCGNNQYHSLLNSTMVVVGFREGEASNKERKSGLSAPTESNAYADPYSNQHTRILSRLLYFISETTKEIEEQNKLLIQLNDQKNEFLGIAAHDLRSPLANIHGFSELLGESLDGELKEMATLINQQSSQMLGLLNELLDITAIESGKLVVKKEFVDYRQLIEHLIETNRPLATKKSIELVPKVDPIPTQLWLDPDKILQALGNILGNAIKFSYPDSQIVIHIYLEEHYVVTEVIDQGQGISAEELDSVFLPFKKSKSKPTAGETSHGLGLAIVKKIMDAHGGELGVKSELGKGSVFYIKIPI